MQRRLWWNSVLKILLLAIFMGYAGMFTFYTHVHVVDGVTIVHAHPFKKAANSQPFHQHSLVGFQLIQSLSSLNVGDDIVSHFVFGTTPFPAVLSVVLPVCRGYAVLLTAGLSLRAPPVP